MTPQTILETGRRRYRRLIPALALVFVTWVLLLLYQIVSYSTQHAETSGDVGIVLGAATWRDEPSPVFAARIDHAIDLYHRGQIERILFTGGRTPGDPLAESEVARNYALRHGVPAEAILVETVSTITYTNLSEARRLLGADAGSLSVLIVSDPLHMRRALTMAEDLGLRALPAPTPTSRYRTWRSKAGFLARETFFYAGYLLIRPFAKENDERQNSPDKV